MDVGLYCSSVLFQINASSFDVLESSRRFGVRIVVIVGVGILVGAFSFDILESNRHLRVGIVVVVGVRILVGLNVFVFGVVVLWKWVLGFAVMTLLLKPLLSRLLGLRFVSVKTGRVRKLLTVNRSAILLWALACLRFVSVENGRVRKLLTVNG
ncbi:hypothetical protein C2G38_2034656 [Gigaspora rosea]|uniref:Transmembrane protein n=1 Tax=Gigaspora rosea TaxID=44941 RepID=A0A397VH51_9GLOM|nr:hypothetical protein C2G38_2034656 [Gigaspora rosea]